MRRSFAVLLTGMLLGACGAPGEPPPYYRFRKQLTPSGKYVIHDYARNGWMAFMPDVAGTEVFGVNEAFKEGEGEPIDGSISAWISDDTLLVYDFSYRLKQPGDTLPIKTECTKVGDFTVKTVFYKSNSVLGANEVFDSVYAGRDSIFIRLVAGTERSLLALPFGGTHVEVKGDSIYAIEISTIVRKSMDFERTHSDGTTETGLPRIEVAGYFLTPLRKISPAVLPEKRVFRSEQASSGNDY